MRYSIISGVVLLALQASAQNPPKPGQTYQVNQVDLNGDGKLEKVGLQCVEVRESGWYSRLTVWNGQGRRIWQSRPAKEGLWAFGGWDWGMSDLQWVGDIDGDGTIEAVVPDPVSDVSPVRFRVFRWRDQAFHHVRTAALFPTSKDEFGWSDKAQGKTWVGAFKKGPVGVVWTTTPEGEVSLKEARLEGTPRGFRVLQWLK